MASKTGRNDPCPCGSGKKYKHCCLRTDNAVQFPGSKAGEDKFAEYKAFVESMDPSDGPVPSFMEYQGMPNQATDVLNDLQKSIEGRSFNSREELEHFMNQQTLSANSAPRNEFLGLSSSQMSLILHRDFAENTSLIELNSDVPVELLTDVPLIEQCVYIFQSLSESEKGIKATQLGNFPRKLTQEFYEKFIKKYDIFEHTPMKEDDVHEIQRLRFFLADRGLIRKLKGRFILTRRGADFLIADNPYELYKTLFVYFCGSFSWLYHTRYSEHLIFIQDSLIFNLHILKLKAGDYISGSELADFFRMAFPQFVSDMESIYRYDIINFAYCHLFLDNFAWPFGLVERKIEKPGYSSEDYKFKKTGLFDKVFSWKI